MNTLAFTVIDPKTGKRPVWADFKNEDWVEYKWLRRIEFLINEDGYLMIWDGCNYIDVPPAGRFEVRRKGGAKDET